VELLAEALKDLPGWAQAVILGLVGALAAVWRSLVRANRAYVNLAEKLVSMTGSTRGGGPNSSNPPSTEQ